MYTAPAGVYKSWGAALDKSGHAVAVLLKRTRAGLVIADLVSVDLDAWKTPFIFGKTPLCTAISSVIVHTSEGSLFPHSATISELSPKSEYLAVCHDVDIDIWTDSCAGSLTRSIPELHALGMSAAQDPKIPASYIWAHFENNQLCIGIMDCGKAYMAQKITTSADGCAHAINRFIRYARQSPIPEICFTTLAWFGSDTSMQAFSGACECSVVHPQIRFRNKLIGDRSQLAALGAARALAENMFSLHFPLPTTLFGLHSLRLTLVNTVRWVSAGAISAAFLAGVVWLSVSAQMHERLDAYKKYTARLVQTSNAVDSLKQVLSLVQQADSRIIRLTPHISALAQAMAPGITLDQIGTDPIAASKSMRCTLAGTAIDEALVTRTIENLQKAKNIVQVSLSSLQARPKPSTGVSFIIVCVLQ